MIEADEASAANPFTGCSRTIFCPIVLMIRQPPAAVPAAMTMAHTTLIQTGISKDLPDSGAAIFKNESQLGKLSKPPAAVPDASASATIPIVFCASLVPCMKPIPAALTNCNLPNTTFTQRGFQRRSAKYKKPMIAKPETNPAAGDANIGTTIFQRSPLPVHHGPSLG